MPFFEFGQLGTPFQDANPWQLHHERTFLENVYFERDVIVSSGASAQGLIRSANFSTTDETGWAFDGAGNAWIYGTTTLGDLVTVGTINVDTAINVADAAELHIGDVFQNDYMQIYWSSGGQGIYWHQWVDPADVQYAYILGQHSDNKLYFSSSGGLVFEDDATFDGTVDVAGAATFQDGAIVEISSVAATVAPNNAAYPEGFSIMTPSSDSSWPLASGLVTTHIVNQGLSGHRYYQTMVGQTGHLKFHRTGASSSTWENWQLVTPYSAFVEDSTAYEIVSAATWETAKTMTLSLLPTTRFEARVSAKVRGWFYNPSSSHTSRIRAQISLDGGSTWTTGIQGITGTIASGGFEDMANFANAGGSVTGTIQVRLQVQSDDAATRIDDMHIEALVVGNH